LKYFPKNFSGIFQFFEENEWEFFFVFVCFCIRFEFENSRQPRAADSAEIAGRTAEGKWPLRFFCSPRKFLVFSIFVSSEEATG
jgi:hypothetical protein